MTLLDAKVYDEARSGRRRNLIIFAIIAALIIAWIVYHYRNYPERHIAAEFFAALQHQNTEKAYAVWMQDPNWKQHPAQYSQYTYNDFLQDWGPSGQWGIIKSYKVNCSYSTASGVIVQATLNRRLEHTYIWVDKSDKKLTFSPSEIDCGNWWGWLTE